MLVNKQQTCKNNLQQYNQPKNNIQNPLQINICKINANKTKYPSGIRPPAFTNKIMQIQNEGVQIANTIEINVDVNIQQTRNIDYYQLDDETRKQILRTVVKEVAATQGGKEYIYHVQNRINQQVDELYSSKSRKITYLIDCLKQSTSFPIVKSRDNNCYNFNKINIATISKELRRVLWSKQFNSDKNRIQFQKVDRQITPYNIQQQLKMSLQTIIEKQQITFKQNQKDVAVKVMEYFVKAHHKIPHRYHNYIALITVDLFSFHTLTKTIDIGATCLGLITLIQYYYESNSQLRFDRIIKAIQIIDEDTHAFLIGHYLTPQKQIDSRRQLNQCYEYFRLTLGASLMSVQISQFIVDHLIIRKRCKVDCYSLFAIMLLIISDEFTQQQASNNTLKQIIERAKTIVKKQDFIEAVSAIYKNISPNFNFDDFQRNTSNKLLAHMLAVNNKEPQPVQEDDDDNFVVNLQYAPRIGYK